MAQTKLQNYFNKCPRSFTSSPTRVTPIRPTKRIPLQNIGEQSPEFAPGSSVFHLWTWQLLVCVLLLSYSCPFQRHIQALIQTVKAIRKAMNLLYIVIEVMMKYLHKCNLLKGTEKIINGLPTNVQMYGVLQQLQFREQLVLVT